MGGQVMCDTVSRQHLATPPTHYNLDAMAGHVAPVARHSPDFDRYEYLLQLSTRSTSLRDLSIWSVSNSQLSAQYERKADSLLTVDCWVDITGLDDNNPIQDVCKRGFAMPASGEGIAFTTGTIRLDPEAPGASASHAHSAHTYAKQAPLALPLLRAPPVLALLGRDREVVCS